MGFHYYYYYNVITLFFFSSSFAILSLEAAIPVYSISPLTLTQEGGAPNRSIIAHAVSSLKRQNFGLLESYLLHIFCFFMAYEEHAAPRTHKHDEEHAHEVRCSRERSRAAWKIIEEYLMPFVEQEKYPISQHCKLHPDNDLFRDQEQHKIHVDINEWRCGYCKKSFQSEKYLDQHFDNRHSNLLNVSHSKCLADFCGALHCDLMMDFKSRKGKCNPAAASRNHHLCESLAAKCFPIDQGPSANRLRDLFLRQFCDAHTCSGGDKPFSRGGRKHTSIFYLAISILTLMLLPIFYAIVYLYQREMRKGNQGFKRISQKGQKPKPC